MLSKFTNKGEIMNKNLPKSKEMFLFICENEYKKLRKDENLIFETLNLAFDWEKEYEKFKKSDSYLEFLNENSNYEKMKIIKHYLEENILFPIVEGLYFKAQDLPITSEILLENTYNTFFDKLKKKVNDKLFQTIEEAYLSLDENAQLKVLEELDLIQTAQKAKTGIINTIKYTKRVANDLALAYLSLGYIIKTIFFFPMDFPLIDKILNKLFTINYEIKPQVKKELALLSVERPEIKDFFDTELNTDIKTILKECWNKNIKVINVNSPAFINSHPSFYKFYVTVKTLFLKASFKPFDMSANIKKAALLNEIKKDSQLNKMVSDYRLCVFNAIIDYLQSYAQVSFEIADIEKKLIKRVEQVKNQRNSSQLLKSYADFFNIKPKNFAEKVFITSVSNLIYLKEFFYKLKMDTNDISFYDRYFKKDIEVLIKKIDQALQNILDAAQNASNRPQIKNYEETLKDNKEKKLVGNEPVKPKKMSVFDI